MIVMIVVVMLIGISEKAQAGPWTRSAFRIGASHRCGGYGYSRYSYRPILGRSSWTNWSFGNNSLGRYSRYGYGRDRTLSRVTGYAGIAIGALQALGESSANDRVLSMAEREQEFKHQQIRAQNNTVLVKRGPIVLQVKKPEQTQSQENQELQQRIRILELELEKLKLQQQAKK